MKMNEIRDLVKRQLYIEISNANIHHVEEWGEIPFAEDTTIINWKSDFIYKTMSIQEEDDDDFEFDAFLAKTGINNEYDKLLICLKNCDKKIIIITQFFKKWFIDNISVNEMQNLIDDYQSKYN